MTQAEVSGHGGAAQIEVTVGESQVLVGHLLVQREGQDLGFVENFHFIGHELDFAGGKLGVLRSGKTPGDGSRYLDDILIAQAVGGFGDRGVLLRTEDDLSHAFAVAQVDEDDTAVVAA